MNSDGDAYLFEDFVNGGRFIWRKEWEASQQVSGGSQAGASPDIVFDFGFRDWASREPQLLGNPLDNESGPIPGLSVQRTDRGLLLWTISDSDAYLFEDLVSGGRFMWRTGWDSSQRLTG
jgi:hypothetical protein